MIAVLGALTVWRLDALSPWLRAVPCLLALAAGTGLAWGRWRGRALDRWLVDLCVYVRRNHEFRLRHRRSAVAIPLRAIRAIGGDGRT